MKVIVCGAGVSGLAVSIRLAAAGHSVQLLEAASYPGGKLTSFTEKGYRFDAGPSLFTLPQLVYDLLKMGTDDLSSGFHVLALDPVCRYFYPDGTQLQTPASREALAGLISSKLGEDGNRVKTYLDKSALVYGITSPVFLENSLHKLSTYFSKSGLRGIMNLWRIDMLRSMDKANRTWFKNPKTVQLFNRYATYNGSNPYKAPATLNVISHLEYSLGAWLPAKGMQDITDVLVKKAESLGVEIRLNCAVAEIITRNKRIQSVRTHSGQELEADVVVSGIDAKLTYTRLLNLPVPGRIQKAENSSSALIFYWGVRRQFPELDVHNIFFSADYEKEFDLLFNEGNISDDPTVYINITSKKIPVDAPRGCENWFVMVNAPANTGQDWEELRKRTRSNVLKKLSAQLGCDIEPLIEYEDYLDPVRIESRTGSNKGSLYGTSSNSRMAAFFRQANFSSAVKGLYFCGGSVHPGGGIPLCLLGARIVANLIPENKT